VTRVEAETVQPQSREPGVDLDLLTLAWLARELERACTELTLPQYRLLALIVRGEERASTLAGRLALARPTVSAGLDTLVANGLVERTAVRGDRRAVKLTITPAGRDALRHAERTMRVRLDALLADAPDPAIVEAAFAQLTVAFQRMGERLHAERGRGDHTSGASDPGAAARERPDAEGARA
jgi:DNA-binding MarR family transcriptional regulator